MQLLWSSFSAASEGAHTLQSKDYCEIIMWMPSIAQRLNKFYVFAPKSLFFCVRMGYFQVCKLPKYDEFFEHFVATLITKHKVQTDVLLYILASFAFGLWFESSICAPSFWLYHAKWILKSTSKIIWDKSLLF